MSQSKNPHGDGEFSNAPYLNFNTDNRQVNLNYNHVDNVNSNFGSGSLRYLAVKKRPQCIIEVVSILI